MKIAAYFLTRMIHFFLGPDIFQKSINNYLEEFKFSNSKFDDLWAKFTSTANTIQPQLLPDISVEEIMKSWMDQKGYPLINVTWKPETKEISISQVGYKFYFSNLHVDMWVDIIKRPKCEPNRYCLTLFT